MIGRFDAFHVLAGSLDLKHDFKHHCRKSVCGLIYLFFVDFFSMLEIGNFGSTSSLSWFLELVSIKLVRKAILRGFDVLVSQRLGFILESMKSFLLSDVVSLTLSSSLFCVCTRTRVYVICVCQS